MSHLQTCSHCDRMVCRGEMAEIHERDCSRVLLCKCGKPAIAQLDNGVPSGNLCDECWKKIVAECRQQSW